MSNRLYSGRNRQRGKTQTPAADRRSKTTRAIALALLLAALFSFILGNDVALSVKGSACETTPTFKMDGVDCTNYQGEGRKAMTNHRSE